MVEKSCINMAGKYVIHLLKSNYPGNSQTNIIYNYCNNQLLNIGILIIKKDYLKIIHVMEKLNIIE